MYSLQILYRQSTGSSPNFWSDYEKPSGVLFETSDIVEAQNEMKYLLNTNPFPKCRMIEVVPVEIEIVATP